MGFRFFRRIKILPGVSLNLSRSGISTAIGVKGAHVTLGHGEVRETVGLPGTGLSYTHIDDHRHLPWVSLLVLAGLLAFLVHLIRHPGP